MNPVTKGPSADAFNRLLFILLLSLLGLLIVSSFYTITSYGIPAAPEPSSHSFTEHTKPSLLGPLVNLLLLIASMVMVLILYTRQSRHGRPVIVHEGQPVLPAKEPQLDNVLPAKKTGLLAADSQEIASLHRIASHDLQAPLRKIQSFSQLILERDAATLSGTGQDYLARIKNAANRMQQLVTDLLDYAAVEADAGEAAMVDLDPLIAGIVKKHSEAATGMEIKTEMAVLPTVPGNPHALAKVFENIIGNSFRFRKQAGALLLTIQASRVSATDIPAALPRIENGYWKITVTDNGIGFEQQYAEKIFDLFYRLHGRSEYDGSGIGLSLARRIVLGHRGWLAATGTPAEGASFTVFLPAA